MQIYPVLLKDINETLMTLKTCFVLPANLHSPHEGWNKLHKLQKQPVVCGRQKETADNQFSFLPCIWGTLLPCRLIRKFIL